MLEKNEKKFCDAHFHYLPSLKADAFNPCENWCGISCAHSQEEFCSQKLVSKEQNIYCAFGIHPQQVGEVNYNLQENLDFLVSLLEENLISAIGECGFDFYTEIYKTNARKQEEAFLLQVEMAIKYKKTLIIHCRKANEKLFEYSNLLKKVKAVLFHSFMGTPIEAQSLLNKGINGYFSFGKQIFNNNKKVIECVKNIPLNKLLLETDAPYQYLKGENKTNINEIQKIYEGAFNLRKEILNFSDFSNIIFENLLSLLYE